MVLIILIETVSFGNYRENFESMIHPNSENQLFVPLENQATRTFLQNAKPEVVIDYLKASHWRFEHELIPRIEQNFLGLIKLVPESNSLPVILNLFIKFQLDMKLHMQLEEKTIFEDFLRGRKQLASVHPISHEDQEPFLKDIIRLLESSDYANNPFCQVLIRRLTEFNSELHEHAWIEENIIQDNARS